MPYTCENRIAVARHQRLSLHAGGYRMRQTPSVCNQACDPDPEADDEQLSCTGHGLYR